MMLQVIFRKKANNHRALLKMTYEDKAFYDSTPFCSPLISELKFENLYYSTSTVQLTLENFGE